MCVPVELSLLQDATPGSGNVERQKRGNTVAPLCVRKRRSGVLFERLKAPDSAPIELRVPSVLGGRRQLAASILALEELTLARWPPLCTRTP
jgi:hypothetical protein